MVRRAVAAAASAASRSTGTTPASPARSASRRGGCGCPVLYDVMGEVGHGRAAGRASTPTWPSSSRTWAASPTTGAPSSPSSTCSAATPTSTPTPPGCAASTCWSRRSGGPGRTRCCSARTARGCTPASSWPRCARCGLPPAAEALVLGGNFLRLTRRRGSASPVRASRQRPAGTRALGCPTEVPPERSGPPQAASARVRVHAASSRRRAVRGRHPPSSRASRPVRRPGRSAAPSRGCRRR